MRCASASSTTLKLRPRWPNKNHGGEIHELSAAARTWSAVPVGKFLISQSTARTALVALACFAFLIAVILTIVGTVGVSVG